MATSSRPISSSAAAASRSSSAAGAASSVASTLKRKSTYASSAASVCEVIDLRGESNKKPKVKSATDAAAASSSGAAAAAAAPKSTASLPKKKIVTGFIPAAFTDAPAAAVSAHPASASAAGYSAAVTSAAAASSALPPRPATAPVIPLPRTSQCAIPASVRQPFVDALFSMCCTHHPTQFSCEELHPSLPSNALLLRLEFELLRKTIRAHPNDASGITDKAAATAAEAQLRTYRESTAIILQLMRDEKDLVAVARIVAQS